MLLLTTVYTINDVNSLEDINISKNNINDFYIYYSQYDFYIHIKKQNLCDVTEINIPHESLRINKYYTCNNKDNLNIYKYIFTHYKQNNAFQPFTAITEIITYQKKIEMNIIYRNINFQFILS